MVVKSQSISACLLRRPEDGGAEPKIDIRDWSLDHSKMGKGISLSAEEIEKLKELI